MNSSGGTHTPAIPHHRKYRNSNTLAVLPRNYWRIPAGTPPLFPRKLHKKRSAVTIISSPVNFRQDFPKSELSARKLAAGLWQLRFMQVSGDGFAAFGDGSFQCSSKGELESFPSCLKCCKEEATKWDSVVSEASNELTQNHSKKPSKDSKLLRDSVVSSLQSELLQALRCINKLNTAQKSSKKHTENFLQKLEEEKTLWKGRECQKIQATFDDFKDKLRRERRSREKMELLNAKLVHELAEANQSAKQFMKNYEEEKRSREIMEEVCKELAMQIGEDKAKLEELERESMKIREEVEEERKMLGMAELLREERVQMKLVDAKVAFEDQYNQMIQLIAYLQAFLRSRSEAESINIEHILKLPFDFSESDDVFSNYEKLRNENGFNNNFVLHQTSSSSDYNTSSSPQRRNAPFDNINEDENILESEAEYRENTGQLKQKAASASKLRSCPINGTRSTVAATSDKHRRIGKGGNKDCDSVARQNSDDLMFDEGGGLRHSSTDAINPHITRGMKGCIEWPRGIPKNNLKAVSLEARVRSQKCRLQHILRSRA